MLSNPIPHNICGKWEAVADIQSAWKCAWCGYVFDQDVSAPVHTYLECEFEQFLAAYIEAALFTCNDESDESGGEPLDKNYGPSDISELAWKSMEEDCRNFLADNYKDLIKSDDWILMGGHNFWMSRCGHGTGFFDADQWSPAVRSRLQKAAKVWGDCHLYVGDDKKIYVG